MQSEPLQQKYCYSCSIAKRLHANTEVVLISQRRANPVPLLLSAGCLSLASVINLPVDVRQWKPVRRSLHQEVEYL